jgi:ribonuclease HI
LKRVDLYTDGACSGNPGPGGWGVLLLWNGHQKELHGGARDTTNNRMELQAVIEGMRALKRRVPVTIHTDSQYVMKGITEWLRHWKARGWRTAAKKPVKNEDLWRELDGLLQGHDVRWRWVRGHSGNVGNERADELARAGIPR